jgi:outer membrane protein OmpA-like peptidoglycan-associated protein
VIGGFEFDRAELGPAQHARIGALAQHLLAQGIRSVRLVGHTDPVGTPGYNRELGQRRAEPSAKRWWRRWSESVPARPAGWR